jgi:hypothetical protein
LADYATAIYSRKTAKLRLIRNTAGLLWTVWYRWARVVCASSKIRPAWSAGQSLAWQAVFIVSTFFLSFVAGALYIRIKNRRHSGNGRHVTKTTLSTIAGSSI